MLPCKLSGICLAGLTIAIPFASAADPKHTNRLARESSPYLLQHAHNPVDWYPWGDEAFAKAKREDKLIFLSVGYAACHWCHVMERESFMDPEVAGRLNERFVCIKVDREERPDVDQIYMTAVQIVSRGTGGWPMSIFILPDGRPFWGGTYFPARTGDRGDATGFLSIMTQVDSAWRQQRAAVVHQAEAVTSAIRRSQQRTSATVEPQSQLVESVADALAEQFDPEFGGFGYAEHQPNRPKFPEPANLVFLLDRMRRDSVPAEQRAAAESMLLKSLDGMISGAMIDHLGGGFHRYSVDRRWQIPHFEKMLYDNGQLATVYAEAFAATGRDEYRLVVERLCQFVLAELAAPGGAFYAAIDADSEGQEGKFYRWSAAELEQFGADERFAEYAEVFGFTRAPNFEHEYFALDPKAPLTAVAASRGIEFTELIRRLEPHRQTLLQARNQRKRPLTDTKILTAWNGLMIAGLADAGRILQQDELIQAAQQAASFVLTHLRDDDGRLLRSHAAGQARLNGYVDDYAFLVHGLIALHRATAADRWLETAVAITDKQLELFWDQRAGGFFFTSVDHPALIVRSKDPVDSAIPSGISVSAENLIYLDRHTEGDKYRDRLRRTLATIASLIDQAPAAAPRGAAAMAAFLDQP